MDKDLAINPNQSGADIEQIEKFERIEQLEQAEIELEQVEQIEQFEQIGIEPEKTVQLNEIEQPLATEVSNKSPLVKLQDIDVTIKCEVGKVLMSLHELANLKFNDIVKITSWPNTVLLKVNNHTGYNP